MKKILFVCTGNTCRSPMAAGLFNKLARDACLDAAAESCGLSAAEGAPASEKAVRAASVYGANIAGHRAAQFSEKLAGGAQRVYCMTRRQADYLYTRGVDARPVSVSDISDPFGGAQADYDLTAAQLYSAVKALVEEMKKDA